MMNCDQVFDVLTRGPFPSGEQPADLAVQRHLRDCSECRELAQALRPALELFQESMSGSESASLPGFWAELEPLAGQRGRARTATLEPAAGSRMETQPGRSVSTLAALLRKHAVPFAAASLLGAIVCWSLWQAGVPLHSPSDASVSETKQDEPPLAPVRGAQTHLQRLAELQERLELSPACLTAAPATAGKKVREDPRADVACCTYCHHADSPQIPKSATLAVAQSCSHCHL